MMVAKDEWTRAAMTDDMLVVELLLRLKQSQAGASSSSLRSSSPMSESLTLRWGIRLPRSKTASSASRFDAAVVFNQTNNINANNNSSSKKVCGGAEDSATRCSPTTPLSWSGGSGSGSGSGSPSATTADGFEESSCPRSKGTATYESTSTTTATKRARRKKTFAELKEEESSLMKERTYLEKEIANLQSTFNQQRAKNDNFKRIKIDLNLHCANFDGVEKVISSQPHERIATSAFHIPSDLAPLAQSDSCGEHKAASARDNSFLLPDLNMVPSGEESGSEILYGMS